MIKINDNFYIDANSYCFMLKELNTFVKDGENKDLYNTIGYYSSIELCLSGYAKYKIKKFVGKNEVNTLNDLKDEVSKLEEEIKQLAGGI